MDSKKWGVSCVFVDGCEMTGGLRHWVTFTQLMGCMWQVMKVVLGVKLTDGGIRGVSTGRRIDGMYKDKPNMLDVDDFRGTENELLLCEGA